MSVAPRRPRKSKIDIIVEQETIRATVAMLFSCKLNIFSQFHEDMFYNTGFALVNHKLLL